MKKVLEKVFRYPAVDLYMLLGFFVAFVSLFIGLSLFSDIWNYNSDADDEKYRSGYSGIIRYSESRIDFENVSSEKDAEVFLEEVVLTFKNDSLEEPRATTVFLSECESPYPVISGEWLFDGTNKKNRIVIGKGLSDALGAGVGDSVYIEGEEYKVSGIVGSERSEIYDHVIALDINGLGAHAKKALTEQDVLLAVRSKKAGAEEVYKSIKNKILEGSSDIVFSEEGGYEKKREDKDNTEAILYSVMYVFAMFHCLIAADVWIKERKYEIAVKRCLGYSETGLFLDLFLQQMRLTLLAAAICFLLQASVRLTGGSLLGMKVELSLRSLCLILAFVAASAFLCVAIPLGNVKKRFLETINGGWE